VTSMFNEMMIRSEQIYFGCVSLRKFVFCSLAKVLSILLFKFCFIDVILVYKYDSRVGDKLVAG